MKASELIKALQDCDPNMEVMGCADELGTYHPVVLPQIVKLVKGNMLFSGNGRYWVEDDGHLFAHDNSPANITEKLTAIQVW